MVRRQILNGDFGPDHRVLAVAVTEALGVPRIPARTALAALAAEGLITKRRGRGYCIVPISPDDVRKRDAARAEAMMREHSNATLNNADLFAPQCA